jgi:hypothetical protein
VSAATPHLVARWRMEGRELVHVGTCPAPEPRAGLGQEDVSVDPAAHRHREPDDDQPVWRQS